MKFKLAIFTMLLVGTQVIYSQTKTVTGSVSDESGAPLPGVAVLVMGTSTGTTTDFDGNYSIDVDDASAQLVFSFIGMEDQTVAVGQQTVINVTMLASSEALEEVVVVGYGSQSRAEVTGAIASVDSEEITALPVVNAEQALQGRAAGVSVVNSGGPGVNPVVRVRGLGTVGNNNPLYVIDGVITGGLSGINPEDIESINVLKDASTTAVYGSRGSNGVIMVTTKKGRSGKAQLTFNAYGGVQTITNRYDVLNTEQYLTYADEAFDFVPLRDPSYYVYDTNWQDQIFQTGVMQNYNLGVSGGNENSNYRFSGGYINQEGAVINTKFERYSFRANSDFTFGKLKIGESMSVAFNRQNPEISNGGRSLIEHAIKMPPYFPVYNEDNLGGYQGPSSPIDGQDAENPVRVQSISNVLNRTTAIIGNIFAQYEIIDGLVFKTQVGLDYYTFNNQTFTPAYNDDSEGTGTGQLAYANIIKNTGTGQTILYTNSLNYDKTFGDNHNFEFLLLAENTLTTYEQINANSRNEITNEVDQLSNESSNLSSNSSETNRIGYLGRVNYNYDGKYIAAASIRRDASSRFGSNNRWGWFPSFALGWNIAKENFMSDSSFSNLKLRGSWGITGNDNIGDYQYSSTLITDFIYPINGNAATGTTSNGLANPDLKWEETTMINVGLDFGLWNEAFTGSLEYYNNSSDDLLMQRSTPTSLGFHSGFITENVGSVETNGFELNLGYHDYDGDFTWSVNLNLGTSKNEVKSLGLLQSIEGAYFENGNISRVVEGESLYHFYGLVSDGIYQNQAEVDAVFTANPGQTTVQPGDIRFKDLNGDGDITSADRDIIGNPYPDLTWGLNLSANYKKFDASLFFSGVQGNEIYNTNIYDLRGMPRLFNSGVGVLDRWTPSNPSNSVPRAGGAPQNNRISDYFVEDGSFARLKNLTIGYTLSDDIFGTDSTVSNFRIYLSGQNLITFSDYSGLDPEIGNSTVLTNSAFEYGIDRGNYPQPISFLLGLQVSF